MHDDHCKGFWVDAIIDETNVTKLDGKTDGEK